MRVVGLVLLAAGGFVNADGVAAHATDVPPGAGTIDNNPEFQKRFLDMLSIALLDRALALVEKSTVSGETDTTATAEFDDVETPCLVPFSLGPRLLPVGATLPLELVQRISSQVQDSQDMNRQTSLAMLRSMRDLTQSVQKNPTVFAPFHHANRFLKASVIAPNLERSQTATMRGFWQLLDSNLETAQRRMESSVAAAAAGLTTALGTFETEMGKVDAQGSLGAVVED